MKNLKITALMLGLALFIVNLVPVAANASTTFETWSERGQKYLAWSRNTLDWTIDDYDNIYTWDAWQDQSGFYIHNEGYQKLSYSDADDYYVNFKNMFLAGAVIGGQTIGYSESFTDQVDAHWNGDASWTYDI